MTVDRRTRAAKATTAPCNASLLAPYNSYGVPAFVERGYYVDTPFACAHCHVDQVWRATQQKWWYEVAKGDTRTVANRCRLCRRKERERRNESRRLHQEGLKRKESAQASK